MTETMLESDAQRNDAFNSISQSLTERETEKQVETPVEIKNEAPIEAQSSLTTTPELIETKEVEQVIEVVEPPKEIEAAIESKTALDYLNEDDDEPTEVVSKKESDEALQLKQRIAELEKFQEDNETKAAIKLAKDAKKAGKSIVDFIKEIGGEDVSKLSTKELFERKLNKYPELTEDERSYELEKFDGMSKLEQLEKTSDIKNELVNSQKNVLEQYVSIADKTETEFADVIKREAEKATAELDELLSKKDYKNLEITPERKRAIKKYVNDNLKNDEKGRFDVNKGVKEAIVNLYEKELLDANRNIAKAKAKQEIFKDITRPSKETLGTGLAPSVNESEEYSKAYSEYLDRQTDKYNI